MGVTHGRTLISEHTEIRVARAPRKSTNAEGSEFALGKLLAGLCLRLIDDLFLKFLHFGIGAERFSHGPRR